MIASKSMHALPGLQHEGQRQAHQWSYLRDRHPQHQVMLDGAQLINDPRPGIRIAGFIAQR